MRQLCLDLQELKIIKSRSASLNKAPRSNKHRAKGQPLRGARPAVQMELHWRGNERCISWEYTGTNACCHNSLALHINATLTRGVQEPNRRRSTPLNNYSKPLRTHAKTNELRTEGGSSNRGAEEPVVRDFAREPI